MSRHNPVEVQIHTGSLWVGGDAYPLRNISHVGQRRLVPVKKKIGKDLFFGIVRIWLVLGFGAALAQSTENTVAYVVVAVVVGLLIWRLVVKVRQPDLPVLYGLIVNTAGTQRDTVWSTHKHEIDHLVLEITKAINIPGGAQMVFHVEHAVAGDLIQQYGAGSIGKASHFGHGNIQAG
ncbi:DUF6232 family protein [Streptomyces omiyaensis]|uniref:DUF6232 family protein n=1 Tax=Streptomyces omiyaensis TaxID=68247 RepID=A0ABW7C0L0_9ACTN|nr:DUF6232 family protein [Streptomyces omiyaensis]GGY63130.1 hypothetical protein GCM10010363_50690 [Streptomyces omiyaensis]